MGPENIQGLSQSTSERTRMKRISNKVPSKMQQATSRASMSNEQPIGESSKFNGQFLAGFRQFADEFDKTYEESRFNGLKLEALGKKFLEKHQQALNLVEFSFNSKFKDKLDCDNNDILSEDLEICETDPLKCPQASHDAKIAAEIWCRIGQGCYLRVTYNQACNNKIDDTGEPIRLMRRAIRYDLHHFSSFMWFTSAVAWHLNDMVNPKRKMSYGRLFKSAIQRTLLMNPEDPICTHLWGIYQYNVANLSRLERVVLKNLFGDNPEGSFEEAEKYILKAKHCDWLSTGLWMARISLAMKRPSEEVRKWIEFGLNLEPTEPTSEIERRLLLELRKKLKL